MLDTNFLNFGLRMNSYTSTISQQMQTIHGTYKLQNNDRYHADKNAYP